MSDINEFNTQRATLIEGLVGRVDLQRHAIELLHDSCKGSYEHVFDWLGLPTPDAWAVRRRADEPRIAMRIL